jgi:hypothetical protein
MVLTVSKRDVLTFEAKPVVAGINHCATFEWDRFLSLAGQGCPRRGAQ